MTPCRWVFRAYEPAKWKGVTCGFDPTREYHYCEEHHNTCYTDEHPTPPDGFCAAELAGHEAWAKKQRRAAFVRYWRTLPARLWAVLRGAEIYDGDY